MESYRRASQTVPGALALPPRWMAMYGDFITKNAGAVSQIESALRSLTYLIPGRFRESELISESLHSFVQVLSLYHDSLLVKAVTQLPPSKRPHPTAHNRYTSFWAKRSLFYKRVAVVLRMISYTELLCEMVAKRRGEKFRWRVVVILEALKAVCRLLLLRLTDSRLLVTPSLPEREVDPKQFESSSSQDELESESSRTEDESSWKMPRTGLYMPSLPDSSEVSKYLLSRVLTADDVKPPKALLHRVSGKGEVAEVLYILRPLLYALAMQHWSKDKKSWRPWLIGVSLEYGARQLAKRDFQDRLTGGLRGLTSLERDEFGKRGWSLGWWAMRGAFYENITKSWVHSIAQSLNKKPLLNLVGGVIEDYEFLWDQYYFSTATL